MNTNDLKRMFSISEMLLNMNLDGITHEDALVQPAPKGNCMNWVVGHILASREHLFQILSLDPFWSEPEKSLYGRGSSPIRNSEGAVHLDKLNELFKLSQKQLQDRLGSMTAEDLATPLPEPHEILGRTVGDAADFLQWHESYHQGQIGTLRGLAGKDGAMG